MTLLAATVFSVEETVRRLSDSLAGLEWAVTLVPARWHHEAGGPGPSGERPWSVAMNLAHMAVYEEQLAAPVLDDLAAGGDGSSVVPSGNEDWFSAGSIALSAEPLPAIIARLRTARQRQIAAVLRFTDERLNAPATMLWQGGWRSKQPPDCAGWVAAKTFQHTWEHGNTILQTALFAPQ